MVILSVYVRIFCECIALLLHFAAFDDLHGVLLRMDFIPFNCNPVIGNSRIQTTDKTFGWTMKKRPIDDDNQVC